MPGFMYFIPDATNDRITPEFLRGLGLDIALRDVLANWQLTQNVLVWPIRRGPGDREGCIVYPLPVDGGLPESGPGYYADRQAWFPCGEGKYWLGHDKWRLPTPADLQRPEMLQGFETDLNGQVWLAPLVRTPAITQEPVAHVRRAFGMDADGKFRMTIRDDWMWLWEASGQAWDLIIGDQSMPWEDAFELSALLLSANYRVAGPELLILQALDTTNFRDVFFAACDRAFMDQMLEAVKKKSSEVTVTGQSNSSRGVAAANQATGRQEPS